MSIVEHPLFPIRRRHPWRDRLALLMSAVLVVSMWDAVAARPTAAMSAPPARPACPAERPDEMSALVTARLCGGRVEIASLLTERMRAWALPTGSISLEATIAPERIRGANGKWVNVDVTLAVNADGSVAPRAHPQGLVFAGAKATGDNDLATMRVGAKTIALGWRGSLPAPVLSGSRATYAEVRPGVDLVVEATRTSFLYSLVVKNRAAATALGEVVMPWRGGGLTAVEQPDGGLELRDRTGAKAAAVPAPMMWDSTVDARSGEHPRTVTLRARVAGRKGGQDLVLSPVKAFLDDPSTVYPVTIDPGPTDYYPSFDTYIQTGVTSDLSGSTELKIGTQDSGTHVSRSFLKWSLGNFLHGATIQSAYLFLWNIESPSCDPKTWQVYWSPWADSSLRWSNQPGLPDFVAQSNMTLGASGCGQNWVYTDTVTGVQKHADDPAYDSLSYRVHAASETNNANYKKFSSAEGAHQPILRITYTMQPTVSDLATTPSTQCISGASRPYVRSTTPTLSGRVTDAEGASVVANLEWWNTGGAQIGSATTASSASGSVLSAAVPSGAFSNGGTYSWRMRGNDGITAGPWSPWCEFTVDTVAPASAPTVTSSTYPSGAWSGSAGTAGDFVLGAGGVADVASYQYGLDTNPPTTVVSAPSLGASATVSIAPPTSGPHTLYVRSLDRAGNASPMTTYTFNVGVGAVLTPQTGDVSAAKFALEALAPSGATGVTYQWRRGDADTWTTIPTADVTVAAGGGAVTWPQASSGGGVFAKLNWDVAKTLNDAEDGAEPRDGPLQVHAVFTGPSTTSDPTKVTFDLNMGSAASAGVGPGSVNLLTGNLTVGQGDVNAFGMGLSRVYNTRQAGGVDAMFGAGWVSSTVAPANPGFTSLTVTGSLVQIGLPDNTTLGFALESGNGTSATYEPQVGAEAFTLTWTSSPDRFTLTDGAGNIVLFTRPSGGATGVYIPSSATPAVSADSTTVSWELVPGSTTQARPTRVLGPVPSGVSCSTLVQGCKALTFTYATSTTATGTAEAQWGDYTARLVKVEFTAYDPDLTPTPGMRTVEVARYTYDSNGRLRAAWDPRLDWSDTSVTPPVTRHVQATYAYDGSGILATLTPPGQEAWQFAYTTVPGDSGLGRLATVSRSALSAGTAVSTVVYRVPVSGSGAPYDLSLGQTSRWAQDEAPTDAAAVFPPTQVPTVNQPAGTLSSSYEYATVSYLDANGRPVNTAAPGGGIDTTWYDRYGNAIRTLTAGNRKRALDASGSDAAAVEAVLASTVSTISTFSDDGKRLLSTVGPEHDVALAAGGVVRGRTRTVDTYDQGAPGSGGPYDLVTTESTSVRYTGPGGTPVDADTRTTTTEYDWTLRAPTVETVDPSGLALTTRTTYDSDGRVVTMTTPAGGTTTNTPSTLQMVYFTVAANATYPHCGGKPHLVGIVCRTFPGGQPATGPTVLAKLLSYNMYGQVSQVVDKTNSTTMRTTTLTFDAAGRPRDVAISAPGLGTDVAKTRNVYDAATGQAVRTQSLDATNAVTAEVVRTFDTLGRLTSYTDADGNTSTTTYDVDSRVATVYDGKATSTYTYDGGAERRGLPTQIVDTGAGTMTATYDTDGIPTSQSWPGNLAVTSSVNEMGAVTSIGYVQTGCGQPDCTVFAETATVDAHGQMLGRTSTLSSQAYAYDAADRLTTVNDTMGNQCTTRVYAFDGTSGKASNRTSLTTFAPNPNGTCQTTTATSTHSYTYDTADRITTSGTVYDNLGRTLTTPAADTLLPASGDATMTYHTNDMVRTISQGSRTATYTLDVIANRFRSWADNGSGSVVTRTHHYTGDGDSPAWTNEGNGTWTRPVAGLAGLAAIQVGPTAGNLVWQVTNLHGDLVAGVVAGTPGLSYTSEQTEFGQPRNTADIGGRRYGWLGSSQRAADTPGGSLLMGARLYNPATARFGSVDPVYGGSANSYDYTGGDPVNRTDVSGSSWCERTGTWTAWWTVYRWTYFRCHINHWVVLGIIVGVGLYGLWLNIAAAALGVLYFTPCSVACGFAAAITWLVGALIAFAAGVVGAAYLFGCKRQNGLYIKGYYVTYKWSRRILWGGGRGASCA